MKSMVRITLHISENVKAKAERRAAEQGHASIEAYIAALVLEDVESPEVGAPAVVSFDSQDKLETKVLEALDTPAREITDSAWEQMKARMLARRLKR